jgi:hypothetical protein
MVGHEVHEKDGQEGLWFQADAVGYERALGSRSDIAGIQEADWGDAGGAPAAVSENGWFVSRPFFR